MLLTWQHMLLIHPVATVDGQWMVRCHTRSHVAYIGYHLKNPCKWLPIQKSIQCWMVRPDTVATGWMGNICCHVSNIASGDWWAPSSSGHWSLVSRLGDQNPFLPHF